jgi:hypothetical protein
MVLAATERPGRRTTIGYDGEGVTGVREFDIVSPTRIYGFEPVTGLPAIGDLYPSYTGSNLACTSVVAEETDQLEGGEWHWVAVANYKTNTGNFLPQVLLPLERDPVMVWTSRLVEKPPKDNKDLDGKRYLNTVGDAFLDPAPAINISHAILSVNFNMSTTEFSGGWALSWLGTVNHASWQGGDKGMVLIEDINAQQHFEEHAYWKVQMTFHFNPDKWEPVRIPSWGSRYWKDDGTGDWVTVGEGLNVQVTPNHKRALDKDGNPILINTTDDGVESTTLVPLFENGTRVSAKDIEDHPSHKADGTPTNFGTFGQPFVLEFHEYNYSNFNLLF